MEAVDISSARVCSRPRGSPGTRLSRRAVRWLAKASGAMGATSGSGCGSSASAAACVMERLTAPGAASPSSAPSQSPSGWARTIWHPRQWPSFAMYSHHM